MLEWLTGVDWVGLFTLVVSLVTLLVVINQLKTAVAALEAAVHANNRIGEGERLLATHDFITKLETDREHLQARRFFAAVRDKRQYDGSFSSIIELYYDSKLANGNEPETEERLRIEKDYRNFISYLNIMEITSVGIQSGCYDEAAMKKWHRGAYVRNIIAAKDAIQKLRDITDKHSLFSESMALACFWADGANERAALGEEKCDKQKDVFNSN